MIGRDLRSTPVGPRQPHHDNESNNRSETGRDDTRQGEASHEVTILQGWHDS
jgi:hypothetical protein